MKSLYGVLVAINDYPPTVNSLKGCVNDRDQFRDFLERNYSGVFDLKLKALSNAEATRQNIIDAFSHFDQAQAGDTCLFFFAGHGSQVKVPKAFAHLESDGKLETIVCHDSRNGNGNRDLIDKELSYLIWKAVNGKSIHFVAIMDCCHSGSNTRLGPDSFTPRNHARQEVYLKPEDFLGFETYEPGADGSLTPPRASHVLLSAALSNQEAKEISANGQSRGVFTFSVLEALQMAGEPPTYADVVSWAAMRVRGLVMQQTPLLETGHSKDKNLTFLTAEPVKPSTRRLMAFDQEKGWITDGGLLEGSTIALQPEDMLEPLTLGESGFNLTFVEGTEKLNPKRVYPVKVIAPAMQPLELIFTSEASQFGKEMLSRLYAAGDYPQLNFSSTTATPCRIHARDQKWWVSLPYDEHPLFPPVGPFNDANGQEFLRKLMQLPQWLHTLRLINPYAHILKDEFSLHLYPVDVPHLPDSAVNEKEADWTRPLQLHYTKHDGQWHAPAFRLKIRNTGTRNLWVSVLHFDSNLNVSNGLLPGAEIAPNNEVWLECPAGNHFTRTIQASIPHAYLHHSICQVHEYLKVVISTGYLLTDQYQLSDAATSERSAISRSIEAEPSALLSSWHTACIELEICCPRDAKASLLAAS